MYYFVLAVEGSWGWSLAVRVIENELIVSLSGGVCINTVPVTGSIVKLP